MSKKVQIDSYSVIKIHDTDIRDRRKCDDCGNVRLTTKLTLQSVRSGQMMFEFLCNDCLTKTPNWPA
jgi:hypothetical protein